MRWQAVFALTHSWLSGAALTAAVVVRPLPWWIIAVGGAASAVLALAAYGWQRDAL